MIRFRHLIKDNPVLNNVIEIWKPIVEFPDRYNV